MFKTKSESFWDYFLRLQKLQGKTGRREDLFDHPHPPFLNRVKGKVLELARIGFFTSVIQNYLESKFFSNFQISNKKDDKKTTLAFYVNIN